MSIPALSGARDPSQEFNLREQAFICGLIYVGVYVIIKGRVIGCPSISNMEDTVGTHTLGIEGATYYRGWKWGETDTRV